MAALLPRLQNNKENAPPLTLGMSDIDALSTSLLSTGTSIRPSASSSSLALSRKKPLLGILGIGKAPSRSSSGRRHSAKPYGRVTSVQRAKKAANKLSKKGIGMPAMGKGGVRRKSPAGPAAAATAGAGEVGEVDALTQLLIEERDKVSRQLRQERWKKSLWNPSTSMKGEKLSIPYKLPMPTLPSIPPLDQDGLRDKSIEHLTRLLSRHLPNIEQLTLAHRPHINLNSLAPSLRTQAQKGSQVNLHVPIPERIALALPHVVAGEQEEPIESRLFKPDVCLVIMGKDDPAPTSMDRKILVPTMSMVLATQCAYWQQLCQIASSLIPTSTDTCFTPSPSLPAFHPSTGQTPQLALDPIAEAEEADEVDEVDADVTLTAKPASTNKDLEYGTSSDWETETETETDTSSDSGSDTTDVASESGSEDSLPPSMIFARSVPLVLPSPKTYEKAHQHLHHPERSFLHDLLAIPQTLRTRGEVLAAIEDRTVQECMDRLEMIEGVWRNLCCLGKVGGKTWEHIGGAWAYTLGVMTGYGILVKGTRVQGGLSRPKSFAEWVAREWVVRQKARDGVAVAEAVKAKRAELTVATECVRETSIGGECAQRGQGEK